MQDSNFVVEDGEFFVMLGPSGCGKTTTLRMIAGLELPTGGQILLGGEDVTMRRARGARHRLRVPAVRALSAYECAQEHRLSAAGAGHADGRDPRSASRRRRSSCASTICSTSPVSGLAGGDRQRVALGRAIVRRPKCFLMDEPLGTLDTEFRDLMVHELRELHNRIHATTVYVTHDQMEAMSMADKIAVMNHGVIEQFGTPQRDLRPAGDHVRRRLHRLAADEFPGLRRRACEGRRRRSRCKAPRSPCRKCARMSRRRELALGVRPEHIRFDDGSRLRGADLGTEYLGTTQIVDGRDGRRHGQGARAGRHPARAGEPVGLAFKPRAAVAVREGDPAARCAPRFMTQGGAAWLTSRSTA